MRHGHDHAGHECLDAILGVDAECGQRVAHVPAIVVPAPGRDPAVDMVPLLTVLVVFHVAAKTLRRPLAVAGRAFEARVLGIVRMRFVAVGAGGHHGIPLVHGVRGRAHNVISRVAACAAHSGLVMNIGRHASDVAAIRKAQARLVDFRQSGKAQ